MKKAAISYQLSAISDGKDRRLKRSTLFALRLTVVLCVLCVSVVKGVTMPPEKFADGVPASAQKILVDMYQKAGREIQQMVVAPTGKTFNARRFNRARAAALAKQINGILSTVRGKTIRWSAKWSDHAYNKGLATAVQQLVKAGVSGSDIPVQGGFSQVDRRAVAVIAADMAIDLETALTDHAKRARRFLRKAAQRIVPDSEISRVVAQGAISGDVRATIRNMRGLLNVSEIDDYRRAGQQIITVGKAHMTVATYAEMLVRTRTRQATVQARSERLVANGCDLVTIVGRMSANFCTEYLGRVFSITGSDGRYPALSELPGGGPPFHPNCSKSTAAYIERFATPAQKRQSHMPDDRFLTRNAGDAQKVFSTKN